jgi:hypothetical protein
MTDYNDRQACAPYPPIVEAITADEAKAIETVQAVARSLTGAPGMPIVTHIPPPLALAIVKALRGEPYQ